MSILTYNMFISLKTLCGRPYHFMSTTTTTRLHAIFLRKLPISQFLVQGSLLLLPHRACVPKLLLLNYCQKVQFWHNSKLNIYTSKYMDKIYYYYNNFLIILTRSIIWYIQGYSYSFLDKYYHTFVVVQNGALLVLWPKALRKKN